MTDTGPKSLDLLGVKPIADAVSATTKAAIDGAAAFLSRICLPASEELGLLLRDRVSAWRAKNVVAIASMAEAQLRENESSQDVHAHSRLVGQIMDKGAWSDVDTVQAMWAGLLASSCDSTGKDDSNMMFVDLLSRLSVSQVRVLEYACLNATKVVSPGGSLIAEELIVPADVVKQVAGVDDFHRLDRELDHLRTFGLLDIMGGGFRSHDTSAGLTPTTLAMHMYARCKGHRRDPLSFYRVEAAPKPEPPPS